MPLRDGMTFVVKETKVPGGGTIYELRSGEEDDLGFSLAIAQEGAAEEHTHPNGSETYVALREETKVRHHTGATVGLRPGEALFIPAGVHHQITEAGEGNLVLVVSIPPYDPDDVVLVGKK